MAFEIDDAKKMLDKFPELAPHTPETIQSIMNQPEYKDLPRIRPQITKEAAFPKRAALGQYPKTREFVSTDVVNPKTVSKTVKDLFTPQELRNVSAFNIKPSNPDYPGAVGLFRPSTREVDLASSALKTPEELAGTISHEGTHAMASLFENEPKLFDLTAHDIAIASKFSPYIDNILNRIAGGNKGSIQHLASEAMAEFGTLYRLAPELLRELAPNAHKVLSKLHGVTLTPLDIGDTLAEAAQSEKQRKMD